MYFPSVRRSSPLTTVVSWPLAVLLCAPVAAWADKPTVLVLPYQGLNKGVAPELAEQTTVVVTQEMGAGGVSVQRADDVADSAAPSAAPAKAAKNAPSGDPAAGDQAQELIAGAKQSIDDQSPGPAIDKLKKAVKLLEANGDAVPDIRIIGDAYLQLAIAHFLDGDEDSADEALTQAIHYVPARVLEDSEYPNLFIRVYNRVRFNVLRRPRGAIEVKASPGAQVLFDGKNVGKAPLNLTEVLPGNHWIRVERAGEAPQVKRLLVRSKATILVEFDGAVATEEVADEAPVGVLGAIAKNELDKSHLEQLRAAGKRAGAAYVMAGAIYRTDTAYNIYTALVSVGDGSVRRAQDIAFDLDMLSAQIEVFNLVADLKKQVGGSPSAPVTDVPFKLAPKLDLKPKKKAVVAAKEAKVQTVVAAPAPIEMPKEAPVVAEGGRAPMGGGDKKDGAVVKPTPSVQPKDESKPGPALVTTVVPRDGGGDDDEGSSWWIWVVAGVVAAGAAGAGSYFLIAGSSSDEGTLRIRW